MLRHYYETENCGWNYKVYVTEIDYSVKPPCGIKYLAEQRLYNNEKWEITDYNKDGSLNIKSVVNFTDDVLVYSESEEGKYTKKYIAYENGLTAISIAEDINNKIHQIDEFWYDQKNNIIKERNWEDGKDSLSFFYYDNKDVLLKCCTYENNDLLTEAIYAGERNCELSCEYNKAGQLLRVIKYYDDENGLFDLMEEFDGTGQLTQSIRWIRTDDLRLLEKIITDGSGKRICVESFQYDKKNRDHFQRRTDYGDGQVSKLTIREYEYW